MNLLFAAEAVPDVSYTEHASWILENVWLLPAIMAASFVLILFFGKRMPKGGSEIGVAAVGVCFLRFAYPLLCALSGQNWHEPSSYQLPAAFSMKKKAGRTEFVRATLKQDEQGLKADRYPKQGSGILSSLVAAEGLIELAEDFTKVEEGDLVTFYPIDQFGFM